VTASALCQILAPSAGATLPVAGRGPDIGSSSHAVASDLRSFPDIAGEPIPFGAARYFGAAADKDVGASVVGMAASSGGRGYWIATVKGTVLAFGHAKPEGSIRRDAHCHVVAIAATRDGRGYWLACNSGAVLAFGDAERHGPLNARGLRSPVVGMAATPRDKGYWLVTSGGAVLHYGNARFLGSAVGENLGDRIVAMAATPDGRGYWLVAADGRVFRYGDARFFGSATGEHLRDHIVAIEVTPGGRGYWLVASGGGVFSYGDARFFGAASSAIRENPIVAAAAVPDGDGYWLLPSTEAPFGLPPPGAGFVAGHVTAIGDSVMLDAQPDLEADIKGIDVEAEVSRQWDQGIALVQQLKSEGRLGAIVVIDLGTNGPVSPEQFTEMMDVLAGASRVVFVTVHLPDSYSWAESVNATLEQGVPRYPQDRLADFNKLADENPQWFGPDGVHMPIGGTGAQAMARLIQSEI